MRRAIALLLVLLVAWLLRRVAGGSPPDVANTIAFALGFALVAAVLVAAIVERLGLPRVSGYLALGLICGPYVGNLITQPMARELQIVNGLAVSLIALIAGLEINLARLRPQLRPMLIVGATILLVMYALLYPALWAIWPWLPIAPDVTGPPRLAFALLLTVVVISFSPTVTIAVIAENRARGPFSQLVLAVVILADLALILVFALAMQLAGWATGGQAHGDVGLAAHLAWEVFGSLAFGAATGAAFAFYLRLVAREVTLVLLGLCGLLSVVGSYLSFEPLLASLAAGLVIENIAPPRGDALRQSIERGSLPVLVLFFATAGASLHLGALAELGLFALGLSAARIATIRAGTALGIRLGRMPPAVDRLWMGLVSQAGVTLGLTIIIASRFPDWGARLQTLVVALIALHEVIGPVLFRAALARAGEIGALPEAAEDEPGGR